MKFRKYYVPLVSEGDTLWVCDNSGVKTVRMLRTVIPFVYEVEVKELRPSYHDKNISINTVFIGVLVRFKDFGLYRYNQVCLFVRDPQCVNRIGTPMFTCVYGGTVAPRNDLPQYQTIINACKFNVNDYLRIDLKTFAKIKEADGSWFKVELTSGNDFFMRTGYCKGDVVCATLKRKPFIELCDVYFLDVFPEYKEE